MADPSHDKRGEQAQASNHNFALDIAHDFGGAIIFSLPLLMTMEMWALGFYMDRFRLALFLLLAFATVMGLSYFEGGEETFRIEVLDALTACAVGYVVATVMLLLLGIIKPGLSADELIGKVALHAVPCSIGAILARRQLGAERTHKEHRRQEQYPGKIFLMAVGAIFLAFQLAPTEEMVLIGQMITGWHATVLALLSLCIMQAFLYSIEAKSRESPFSAGFFWGVFMHLTIVGYALALLLSLYVLWTFGRLEGEALREAMLSIIVLGFPAALGASAARLIL
jgi:putative integral membrane protein (TIGR02587 family)